MFHLLSTSRVWPDRGILDNGIPGRTWAGAVGSKPYRSCAMGNAMPLRIQQHDIEQTNLRTVSEIWLAGPACTFSAESEIDTLCFWRGRPVVSHEMLSEGTHEQNLQRLWLVVADICDNPAVATLEARLRTALDKQNMEGEFYPAEQKNTTRH
ncbi:hypothetical protein [Pseudomonas sp. CFBP 13710]|uniref:hypothetical protein n=1 Tax=Pseudomonas sp. CFBP 13710 TaxID=2775311 RepID=UPI001FCFED08|nr:hypothetical protein [Pseudomonas sp. CFBP 13710]